ncbi:MAG: hypothetical protein H5U40_15190, partial [Polyangiaceae bacterium]|nr:hypothetical protein [Polyangiaceae bacterium]
MARIEKLAACASLRRQMVLGFSQFGREASAIAQQGWLIARRVGRPLPSPTGDRVALFVHGFMASGAVFDPMRARVSSATGLATLDFSYGLFERFESIAERLASTIESSVPRGVGVSLVGHSLGGLVARWYIQE